MAEVSAWQARVLEPMYPVVVFDALRVKIRWNALVRNKALHLARGGCLAARGTSWAFGWRAPKARSSG